MLKMLGLSVIMLSMVGCASVPMETAENDAQLKQFTVSSDNAGVYIYRNESFGGAVKMDVAVNDQLIGETSAKTYLYKELPEGQHTISSLAENTDTLTLDVVKGKLYYVWQEVKMGIISARTKLSLVDETQGQQGVSESKAAITK